MTNIIVISRDKEMRKFVRAAAEGLEITLSAECATMKEAMETLRKGAIRIAVVDLFLEGSSGIDAIKTLKKIDESLVLILLTRMHSRGLLERAFRFGATDVLVYPLKVESLRQTLMHRLDLVEDANMITFHQS